MNSGAKSSICIFVNSYPPAIGGIETFTKMLAQGMVNLNFAVTVIVKSSIDSLQSGRIQTIEKEPEILYQTTFLNKLRAAKKSDLVIFSHFSLKALPFVFLTRKKFVIIHHTSPCAQLSRIDMRERLKRFIYSRSVNIFVSENLKQLTKLDGFVIHNGTDFPVHKDIQSEGRHKDFIYIGRLVHDKGIGTAIRAFSRLLIERPELTFHIAGSGEIEDELIHLVDYLGIVDNVRFLGNLSKVEVIESLLEHKFLILPSEWQEPFGLVSIEALTQGCIPVVARIGGIVEACGKHCMTFESGDVEDLHKVLEQCISNYPSYHAQIFEKINMQNFSSDRMLEDYVNLLDQLFLTKS
jgi:glycogen(starch) synthase